MARNYLFYLLPSKQTFLPGKGINARYCDPRPGTINLLYYIMSHGNDLLYPAARPELHNQSIFRERQWFLRILKNLFQSLPTFAD